MDLIRLRPFNLSTTCARCRLGGCGTSDEVRAGSGTRLRLGVTSIGGADVGSGTVEGVGVDVCKGIYLVGGTSDGVRAVEDVAVGGVCVEMT